MELRGPWPYLLFFALDGAAGVCAVLLARRAARAESGLAPRLAVWGLVASSSFFNWTHAPRRPAAPEAFGLMPVIAALLFEFCLREIRLRTANRADRKLSALRWLRPAERIRVQLRLAADEQVSAEEATRQVRVDSRRQAAVPAPDAAPRSRAGNRPWHARRAPHPAGRAPRPRRADPCRVHRAADRLRGAPPGPGADHDRDAGQARLRHRRRRPGSHRQPDLLASRRDTGTRSRQPAPAHPAARDATGTEIAVQDCRHTASFNGHRLTDGTPARAVTAAGAGPETSQQEDDPDAGDRDAELVAAATRIVADARQDGTRLSQIALAEKLRREGYTVANNRLRWLAAVSGLEAGQDAEPDTRSTRRPVMARTSTPAAAGQAPAGRGP